MESIVKVIQFLESKRGEQYLQDLYGNYNEGGIKQGKRYLNLLEGFKRKFPSQVDIKICSAPGRTEIGGNHTDHQNGRVLAAAINLDTIGIGARSKYSFIRIYSDSFNSIEVNLDDLEPHVAEKNTSTSMVRGICHYLRREGYQVNGFDAILDSTVPGGSGLSSSASFEILIAQMINVLYNNEQIGFETLARSGHFAEVEYFKKPCGLMDQMTISLGGLVALDFLNTSCLKYKRIDFDMKSSGHALMITQTGGSHVDLTDEYAAVTSENRAVAQFFIATVLREVDERSFQSNIPELRKAVGDRAVLRAIHFFNENRRVLAQIDTLEGGDFDKFLGLVNESGDSSWKLLQNCYSVGNPREQGIPLGLTLSKQLLRGRGATRVHGGGFAGTIQAYVPQNQLKSYKEGMESVFGFGACRQVEIRHVGATRLVLAT